MELDKILEPVATGIVSGTAIICFILLACTIVWQSLRSIGTSEGVALAVIVIGSVVLIPLLIALAGALSIKLSSHPAKGLLSCIVTSEIAGLATVLTASILSLLMLSFFIPVWQLDGVSAASGNAVFFDILLDTVTDPWMIGGTLVVSLFAVIGGMAYRELGLRGRRANC